MKDNKSSKNNWKMNKLKHPYLTHYIYKLSSWISSNAWFSIRDSSKEWDSIAKSNSNTFFQSHWIFWQNLNGKTKENNQRQIKMMTIMINNEIDNTCAKLCPLELALYCKVPFLPKNVNFSITACTQRRKDLHKL